MLPGIEIIERLVLVLALVLLVLLLVKGKMGIVLKLWTGVGVWRELRMWVRGKMVFLEGRRLGTEKEGDVVLNEGGLVG